MISLKKLSFKEIINELKKHLSVEDFAHVDDTKKIYYKDKNEVKELVKKLGNWVDVEEYGGMDKGINWYVIKHFPEQGIHIKVSGFYYSYHGVDFEDWDKACKEVTLREKIITVYE